MKPLNDHWLILRTSSRNTLRLCEQLVREGFEAWSPKRTFAKQGKGEMLTITAPMMPSFAFAKAGHVHSLLGLADDPKRQIDFNVFTFLDRIPFVCDGELEPLRRLEASDIRRLEVGKKPRRREITLLPGEAIRMTVGAWAGKIGIVEKDDGRVVSLSVDGRRVKISSFHLGDEMALCDQHPAAEAA